MLKKILKIKAQFFIPSFDHSSSPCSRLTTSISRISIRLLRLENEVDPSGTGSYCDWDLGFRYTDEARGHMQGLMPTQQLRIGPSAPSSLSPPPPPLFFFAKSSTFPSCAFYSCPILSSDCTHFGSSGSALRMLEIDNRLRASVKCSVTL